MQVQVLPGHSGLPESEHAKRRGPGFTIRTASIDRSRPGSNRTGMRNSDERDGDTPKVDVRDPLAPHKALLRLYTDKEIHDITAYLVTLK